MSTAALATRSSFQVALLAPVEAKRELAPVVRRAPSAMDAVRELDVVRRWVDDDRKHSTGRFLMDWSAKTVGLGLMAGGGLMGLLGLVAGRPDVFSLGLGGLVLGVVGSAVASAGGAVAWRLADRRVLASAGPALETVEQAATTGTPLVKDWLAYRAKQVLKPLDKPTALVVTRRLGAIADSSRGGSRDVEGLESVYRFMQGSGNDLYQGSESFIAAYEKLGPEARSLVRDELRTIAQQALSNDPCNKWRLARVLAVIDGEAQAYTDAVLDLGQTSVSSDDLLRWRGRTHDETRHAKPEDAIRVITAMIVANDQPARVVLTSEDAAEKVAAHFERRDFRAAIYGGTKTCFVTVYKRDTPPPGQWIKGWVS